MSLKIAFGKGRGASACIGLLEECGIVLPPEFPSGRLTAFDSPAHGVVLVQVRSSDLPWLLENGHIDVAFGSSIWFEEHASPVLTELMSLNICPCRLSLIVAKQNEPQGVRRVCTRFPKTTLRKAASLPANVQIIQMSGCNEVGLVLQLCEAIVDVVETGWTLRNMALEERQVLCKLSHGLWVRQGGEYRSAFLRTLLARIRIGEQPSASLRETQSR